MINFILKRSLTMKELVRELEKLRFNSLINKEYDQFSSICHEHLRYVHTSGTVDNLSSFMNKLKAGYYDYQKIDFDICEIIDFQDCVIVVGDFYADLYVNQEARKLQNRAMSIWKKEQDQLKLFIYQATPFK